MSLAKPLANPDSFLILSKRVHEYKDLVKTLSTVVYNDKRASGTTDVPDGVDPEEFARAIATLVATSLAEIPVPVHRLFYKEDEILGKKFMEELMTHVGYIIVVSLEMRDLATNCPLHQHVDERRQDALATLVQARKSTMFLMVCDRKLHVEVCGASNGKNIITQMLVQKEY